jgi:hypothetical protein
MLNKISHCKSAMSKVRTLSSCSLVCAADKQNLIRPSMRGVAGKPTPTTAMKFLESVLTTALTEQNCYLIYRDLFF